MFGGRREVILREKMPLHQLSEGLLITRPGGGGERWREGEDGSSSGKGGGGRWGLGASLQLNRSAGTR